MNWAMLRFGRRFLLRRIPVQSIEWNVLDLRACSGATGSRYQWSNAKDASLLYWRGSGEAIQYLVSL